MNVITQLWRSVPSRSILLNPNVFRLLSTATVTPLQQIEELPRPVELDKLYKRVELEMRGIDPAVLLSYSWFCIAAASHLGIEVTKSVSLSLSDNVPDTDYGHLWVVHASKPENSPYCSQRCVKSTNPYWAGMVDMSITVLWKETCAQQRAIDSWALRKAEKERHTLLRCVHIYKKHRVQYEIRSYFRFIHLQRLTGSSCDTYLEYIERNLPEGCALKVTKIECQGIPDHISPPVKEK